MPQEQHHTTNDEANFAIMHIGTKEVKSHDRSRLTRVVSAYATVQQKVHR